MQKKVSFAIGTVITIELRWSAMFRITARPKHYTFLPTQFSLRMTRSRSMTSSLSIARMCSAYKASLRR